MELVVWKHKIKFMVLIPMTVIIFCAFIIFTILALTNIVFWGYSVSMLVFFLMFICLIFFDKNVFSKLTFSEQGIKWTRFNKEIMYMKWENVTDIKQTYMGPTTFYLTFVSGDKSINMDIASKKMYKEILNICPNENIKFKIKNLDFLRNYNKN